MGNLRPSIQYLKKGETAFNIFPNPTRQENVNLSFKGFENEIVLVVVRDIQGKEHYSKVTVVEENDEIQLLLIDSVLPKGIYLVTASSMNQLYSQKVIIK